MPLCIELNEKKMECMEGIEKFQGSCRGMRNGHKSCYE